LTENYKIEMAKSSNIGEKLVDKKKGMFFRDEPIVGYTLIGAGMVLAVVDTVEISKSARHRLPLRIITPLTIAGHASGGG
jgi:hypothetical protein